MLYAGPMVAFAILIAARNAIPNMAPWTLVRTYRAWGAGFGISLGLCILGGLTRYYLRHGSFTWGWSTPAETRVLATFLCFLAMWASNIKLEIWSLEPLRKLDKDGDVADPEAYRAATASFSQHLTMHAVLALLVAGLAITSGLT